MPFLNRCLPFLLAFVLWGCGGGAGGGKGGGGTTPGPVSDYPSGTIPAKFVVDWPARTRAVGAPKAAEAFFVRFTSASNPGDIAESGLFLRPEGAAASHVAYLSPRALSFGTYTMEVHFGLGGQKYPEIAVAAASVELQKDGSLRAPGGGPLGDIVPEGRITKITVAPDQSLDVGSEADPVVTATTADFSVVALAPGALTLVSDHPSAVRVNANSSISAIAEGSSNVRATVDGLTSDPAAVHVIGHPLTPRRFLGTYYSLAYDAHRGRLWLGHENVSPAGYLEDLDLASGTLGPKVVVGRQPVAMALSDDARTLNVVLSDELTLLQFNPETRAVVKSSHLSGVPYGTNFHTMGLLPGTQSTVAVASVDERTGKGVLAVYDDGILRPATTTVTQGSYPAWTSPSRIISVSESLSSEARKLFEGLVEPDGVRSGQSVPDAFQVGTQGFTYDEGRIYGADYTVRDANSFALLGKFDKLSASAESPNSSRPVVQNGMAYYLEADARGARLSAFRTSDFSRVSTRHLTEVDGPFYPSRQPQPVGCGPDRLAFVGGNVLYLIDGIPRG